MADSRPVPIRDLTRMPHFTGTAFEDENGNLHPIAEATLTLQTDDGRTISIPYAKVEGALTTSWFAVDPGAS